MLATVRSAGHVAGIKRTEIPASRPVLVGETDKRHKTRNVSGTVEREVKWSRSVQWRKIKPGRGFMGLVGGPQAL